MGSVPSGRIPLSVLMYHDVVDDLQAVTTDHRPYAIPTWNFKAQMTALAECGVSVTRLDSILGVSAKAVVGEQSACVLTFDDGHESNYTRVLPELAGRRFSATFFITTGWVGRASYLTWDQIRALAAAGMEIGSHSVTNRAPSTLSTAELRAELSDSRKVLEDHLGQSVFSASSPTGFFNPEMIPVAREAGYRALCCGRIGLWIDPEDSFAIPRIPVKLDNTTEEVRRMALGDRRLIRRLRRRQVLRDRLKAILGVERYRRLRKAVLSARHRGA